MADDETPAEEMSCIRIFSAGLKRS